MNDKKNILYIGNCQVSAIQHLLNLDPNLYDQNYICPYQTNISDIQKNQLITNSDIVITQPISDRFGELSVNNIARIKKQNTKMIVFPSCYMRLYYFDSFYYYHKDIHLKIPHDYHYNKIIESFFNNYTIDKCINEYIYNPNLKTKQELIDLYNIDIEQIKTRTTHYCKINNDSNIYILDITNFIEKTFKEKLLFYTFNHPTGVLLEYIALLIKENLDLNTQWPKCTDVLADSKGILYSCMQNILNFDIKQFPPNIVNYKNIEDIIQFYHTSYKTQGLTNEDTEAGAHRDPITI